MRILSATECISPAIERTKLVLFTPFRKGRSWKLSATAYLAVAGSVFMPFPLIYLAFIPFAKQAAGMVAVVAIVAAVLLVTAIYSFFYYLFSRIQFAYFDIVLNRGEFVAPAWRKYGSQARIWTLCKIFLGTLVALAISAPLAAYVPHFVALLKSMPPGQQPTPQSLGAITGAFYAVYGLVALVYGVFYLISGLLGDFIVPSLALENTGLKEAFRRMAELIQREPGEFALYALLKTVLGIGAYMGAAIFWEIVSLIGILIIGLVAAAFGYLLHLAGVSNIVLIVLAIPLGIAIYGLFFVYGLLLVIGPIFTFLDAYALYFLGGRYPLLGELLDRSTPPPAYLPYPPNPPPSYLAPVPPLDSGQ
jgi:hypothetical protein